MIVAGTIFLNITVGSIQFLFAIIWFIFGIGALRLKNWARLGMIICPIYFIYETLYPIQPVIRVVKNYEIVPFCVITFGLLFFVSEIFIFTRPKVKELFR